MWKATSIAIGDDGDDDDEDDEDEDGADGAASWRTFTPARAAGEPPRVWLW